MTYYIDSKGQGFTVTKRRNGNVYGHVDGQTYICQFSAAMFAQTFTPRVTLTLFDGAA